MKHGKKRWWHLTQSNRGARWTAQRICPPHIGTAEPRTPRLCVSESIAGCYCARAWTFNPIYVYRTEFRRAVRPRDVWDASITGERWVVPPCELFLEAVIPGDAVRMVLIPLSGMSPERRVQALGIGCAIVRECLPHLVCHRTERLSRQFARLMADRRAAMECGLEEWDEEEPSQAAA